MFTVIVRKPPSVVLAVYNVVLIRVWLAYIYLSKQWLPSVTIHAVLGQNCCFGWK